MKIGAKTNVIVETNFIKICIDGPAVSLKGSPTVSPITAALWDSEFFPPYAPVSIYFLALSQAPPELLRNNAINIPVAEENIKYDAAA